MMNKKFDNDFDGMLFLMDDDSHSFWMKNCIIPLDIIFIKDNLKIVDIFNMYKKDKETKKGLMYVFLYETKENLNPDIKKAKDGHEHSKCGYFTKETNPIGSRNKEFRKIITNIFNKH